MNAADPEGVPINYRTAPPKNGNPEILKNIRSFTGDSTAIRQQSVNFLAKLETKEEAMFLADCNKKSSYGVSGKCVLCTCIKLCILCSAQRNFEIYLQNSWN